MSRIFLEKLIVALLAHKVLALYERRWYMDVFTTDCHRTIS
jgi:hypothetical protein